MNRWVIIAIVISILVAIAAYYFLVFAVSSGTTTASSQIVAFMTRNGDDSYNPSTVLLLYPSTAVVSTLTSVPTQSSPLVTSGSTMGSISNLPLNTLFTFKISGMNSNPIYTNTTNSTMVPNLTNSLVTTNSMTVTCSSVPNATSYQFILSPYNSNYTTLFKYASQSSNSYNFTSISPGYYKYLAQATGTNFTIGTTPGFKYVTIPPVVTGYVAIATLDSSLSTTVRLYMNKALSSNYTVTSVPSLPNTAVITETTDLDKTGLVITGLTVNTLYKFYVPGYTVSNSIYTGQGPVVAITTTISNLLKNSFTATCTNVSNATYLFMLTNTSQNSTYLYSVHSQTTNSFTYYGLPNTTFSITIQVSLATGTRSAAAVSITTPV